MISLKQELADFMPIDIKELEEMGQIIPDNVKNSIVLYNKAIESLKQNSEDIAVIELKRAISMNPAFHEAMNLLGLCYSYTKEYAKAAEMFNKVVAGEKNGIKALRYLDALKGVESSSPEAVQPEKKAAGKNEKEKKAKDRPDTTFWDMVKGSGKSDIVKYVIGFVAGAVMVFLISLPFNAGNGGASLNNEPVKAPAGQNSVLDEAKYNELANSYQDLKKQLEASKAQVDYYRNVMKIFEAEQLASQQNYQSAADVLVLLKTVEFKDAEKEKYDSLYKTVMPRAVQTVFQEGLNLYNAQKYADAAAKLSKIQAYGTEWPYANIGMYYLGKSYMGLNDSKNAVSTFQKVKELFPGTQYASWSDQRIKQLTAVP
ncbi:MAG: tetratricopeptide repeat protein [Clostridiales bacterium]|nr:tetratricopeptide repeat protein [Eubacteriales bacterium]MDH7565836.1 tetratricopeptide repeat protein [Clostridiales bacterium]